MDIIILIGQFLIGLLAIIKGADWMTDGASAVARRFGISTLVIGMTIVAIGSSAPEFVVSAVSALKGNTEMAIGNVVGSNIFNILSIMGATALVAPIAASKGNIRYDVPFVLLSSIAVAIACLDNFIGDGGICTISRSEGLLMLCIFAIFISYTIAIAKKDSNNEAIDEMESMPIMPVWKSAIWIVGGLACLIIGGDMMVDGASGIATMMGVSQAIIALTIVSIGTSAPELAASMMAAKKGDTAMALGNIVGSVVFNVFFVLGTSAAICPLELGNISLVDIITLILASCLLWVFCKHHHALVRWEGIVLILIQVIYYVFLIYNE